MESVDGAPITAAEDPANAGTGTVFAVVGCKVVVTAGKLEGEGPVMPMTELEPVSQMTVHGRRVVVLIVSDVLRNSTSNGQAPASPVAEPHVTYFAAWRAQSWTQQGQPRDAA